jgi:hypothetical protein
VGCRNCFCDGCRAQQTERAALQLARYLLDPDLETVPGTMAHDLANDPTLWRKLARMTLPENDA